MRLKLIYGLGVINRQEYEDAELLMALREELNHDGNEYAFTDDEILGPFGELHCVGGAGAQALSTGCAINNGPFTD